jgi:hypothetical protein
MKTELQKTLASIAPSIHIQTVWSIDEDYRDIRKDCDGFDDEDPNDWTCWQSEIRATCIIDGEEVSGSAYLGGTWGKAGDLPEYSNPEISGYEPQMTEEALDDLRVYCDTKKLRQINKAVAFIKRKMETDYKAQRQQLQKA